MIFADFTITSEQWNKIVRFGHHHPAGDENVTMIPDCADHHSALADRSARGIHELSICLYTRNRKHRRAAAKSAACAKPLMEQRKREGG